MNTLTIIISGGRGLPLSVLTDRRAIPAIPMAGSCRLIDFTLANVASAGLDPVVMLAQTHSASLREHLGKDGPWGTRTPRALEVSLWLASRERTGQDAYIGSADALYQNRRYITESGCETLLLLPGDQIYRLDYQTLLGFHRAKGADLTVVTKTVSPEEAHLFGTLDVDGEGHIQWFEEKPQRPRSSLASLAIYAVKTSVLLRCLDEDARDPGSLHNLGRDIIPRLVAAGRAYAYPLLGYWDAIATLPAWWKANMAFIDDESAFELCTFPQGAGPAAVFGPPARLGDSLASVGCVIEGEALHSVLSPEVRIEKGARVYESALLDGVVIRSGAVVERCVLDAGVEVGAGVRLGGGEEDRPNQDEPGFLYSGLSVAGAGACIPPGAVIGRNCYIHAGVTPEDFSGLVIPAGSSVRKS